VKGAIRTRRNVQLLRDGSSDRYIGSKEGSRRFDDAAAITGGRVGHDEPWRPPG